LRNHYKSFGCRRRVGAVGVAAPSEVIHFPAKSLVWRGAHLPFNTLHRVRQLQYPAVVVVGRHMPSDGERFEQIMELANVEQPAPDQGNFGYVSFLLWSGTGRIRLIPAGPEKTHLSGQPALRRQANPFGIHDLVTMVTIIFSFFEPFAASISGTRSNDRCGRFIMA